MTGWRDARLQKALESAPDAQLRPQPHTRQAILARAQQAVSQPAPASSWWQRLWSGSGQQRMPWNAAFATIALATLVTVLWHDREVPGPRSEAPQADQPARPDTSTPAPGLGSGPSEASLPKTSSVPESPPPAVTRPAVPSAAGQRDTAPSASPLAKSQPKASVGPAVPAAPEARSRAEASGDQSLRGRADSAERASRSDTAPLAHSAPAAAPPAQSAPTAAGSPAVANAPGPAATPAPAPTSGLAKPQSPGQAGATAPAAPPRSAIAPPAAAPAPAVPSAAQVPAPPAAQRAEKSLASPAADTSAAATGALSQRGPSAIDTATHLRIESAGRSVDVPIKRPSRLADLLATVIAGARGSQPLEAAVTLRAELRDDAGSIGVLEIAGPQVRWRGLRGNATDGQTATPEPALLQSLREELDAAAVR